MPIDKEELLKECLEIIEREKIRFIDHLVGFLPYSRNAFYTYFPVNNDNYDTIKKAIDKNRISSKTKALNRWEESENPTLQVAFYKLIGTQEERDALNGKSEDNNSNKKIVVNVRK